MNDSVSTPAPELKTASVAAPPGASAVLALADGTLFWGRGLGARRETIGEVIFNTSITGYQEIITDPSYAAQIITFTFPHIGNVGTNPEDIEAATPAARGVVMRWDVTQPSSWRAVQRLDAWLVSHDLPGVAGIDTRSLTHRIRDLGAPNACLAHFGEAAPDTAALVARAAAWPGLEGLDLAAEVSCRQTYRWTQTRWSPDAGYGEQRDPAHHVVAVDFGAKRNILRSLASLGCRVTVVPADTEAERILALEPDGIFLANGPGDPAATGRYAVPTVKRLIDSGRPVFGICLGHQILALALGARTRKMHLGHHGANHPVKELASGRVEITSQNHGFEVDASSLPEGVEETHVSLFDGSNEGLRLEGRPVFSVQYHPEASPGPEDSHYLFERFVDLIERHKP